MVLDVSDGSFVSPIEIFGEIVGGEDGGLLRVRRQAERFEAEELAVELRRSEIGESGDAVDGGGVELRVKPRPAQVWLEYAEAMIVLLLRRVGFPELRLEGREVVLGVQQVVLHLSLRHHLTDQDVVGVGGGPSRGGHGGEEEESTESVASHGEVKGKWIARRWNWWKFKSSVANSILTRVNGVVF